MLHRDIKPSNILLGDRTGNSVGQVYLIDFGAVQTLAAREGGTFTIVGTYGYTPFEQYGGRATPASDLYALGATLIYLAIGKHPADLPQKDGQIQFKSLTHLSPALTDWLQQMTEPSLDKRFADSTTALLALAALDLLREMLLMELMASEDSSDFNNGILDTFLDEFFVVVKFTVVISAISIVCFVAWKFILTIVLPGLQELFQIVLQKMESSEWKEIKANLIIAVIFIRVFLLLNLVFKIMQILRQALKGEDLRQSIVVSLSISISFCIFELINLFLLKI